MPELGQFLKQYRIDKNLSKREFARKIHTSPDTVERIIEGEHPTIKTLRSISGYTGMSLLALLRMAFPNEIPQPSAKAIAAAEKIDAMPEPRRTWFFDLIDNADTGGGKAGGNEGEIGLVKK